MSLTGDIQEPSGKGTTPKVLGAENGVDPERTEVRWRDDVGGWEVIDLKCQCKLCEETFNSQKELAAHRCNAINSFISDALARDGCVKDSFIGMNDSQQRTYNHQSSHPLELAFRLAVEQATKGKGERHGGDSVPFYDQQWTTLADCHGVGFLTGQAAKKLNEAAQKTDEEAWEREVLGALVYAGMAILKKRGYPE